MTYNDCCCLLLFLFLFSYFIFQGALDQDKKRSKKPFIGKKVRKGRGKMQRERKFKFVSDSFSFSFSLSPISLSLSFYLPFFLLFLSQASPQKSNWNVSTLSSSSLPPLFLTPSLLPSPSPFPLLSPSLPLSLSQKGKPPQLKVDFPYSGSSFFLFLSFKTPSFPLQCSFSLPLSLSLTLPPRPYPSL